MTVHEQTSNTWLYVITALIAAVCSFQLVLTAVNTNNWHGAWISITHVIVVVIGSVLALRN